MDASLSESLGYHPCSNCLTSCHELAMDNVAREFDGAVASERVWRRSKFPQNGWKPFEECKGRRELDCDTDGWSR